MKDLITFIAQALVDHPEQVSVREFGGSRTKVLEQEAANADIRKIIGSKGHTARAMRALLGAASARGNKRMVLEIVE